MLIIQSGSTKRFRKYSIMMAILLAISGRSGALMMLLTLHWYASPPKK
jgi:hypothetical protein